MPVIFIIRPETQTADDIALCNLANWRAIPFSPIAIKPDTTALSALNTQFHTAQAVCWSSPTAIKTAAPYIDFSDSKIPHITVGRGSRKALSLFCTHNLHNPESGNDSEAVLDLPIWHTLQKNAEILIIRGYNGRNFLIHALHRRGFRVKTAEVYFRQSQTLDWSVFEAEKPQAAYITSAQMVRELFAQAPERITQSLRTLLYFTHHPRIAGALHAAGAQRIELVKQLSPHILNNAAWSNK